MKKSGLADSPLFSQEPKGDQNTSSIENHSEDSMPSCYQDTMVDIIRRAINEIGKEASTYRLTHQEKKAILEINYSYLLRGIKVSENEIIRIAINFILYDYRINKKNSLLEKVIISKHL
jgi:hypothetical protein